MDPFQVAAFYRCQLHTYILALQSYILTGSIYTTDRYIYFQIIHDSMAWQLNRQTGKQEYNQTTSVLDTPKGLETDVHFIDAHKQTYIRKYRCRVIQGTLYPEKGVMMTPQAQPVSCHGGKWVHWVGAIPR
jgi:hypothetical protein